MSRAILLASSLGGQVLLGSLIALNCPLCSDNIFEKREKCLINLDNMSEG
jgi:hypothetical protein